MGLVWVYDAKEGILQSLLLIDVRHLSQFLTQQGCHIDFSDNDSS